MNKRIIMTVGAPGAGKTTWEASLDKTEWLVLSLDHFRQALFQDKGFYWTHVVGKHGMDVRRYVRNLFWFALRQALADNRFNIALVNTYVYESHAADDIKALGAHEKRLELVVFDVEAETLWRRNMSRPVSERLQDKHLAEAITAFFDPKAWWRDKRWNATKVEDFK